MFLAKTYYLLKPIIPWRLRILVRRARAIYLRERYKDIWPINQAAAARPPGWPGWPSGKEFAFVLTHDVESFKGLQRCQNLMELDESLGFCSSFNFVPECYDTPRELRDILAKNGFEVGIHDLKHDGRLYSSRETFRKNAEQINGYLKKWNAVGFRSAFMLHNLEWLHDLNILYDASTFDTDVLEPQPDGVNTIFPFCVRGQSGQQGYVELPYTLCQDFNLFIVLKEKSIDLWKRKIDWVAAQGGMVLLNSHPDYMSFKNGAPKNPDEYDVSLYAEVLKYLREKYQGRYWHALARDAAKYCRQSCEATVSEESKERSGTVPVEISTQSKIAANSFKPLHIAVVGALHYDYDNRTRRYAETLQERGHVVDVVAIRSPGQSLFTIENGVNLYRIHERVRNEKGKFSYLGKLCMFLVKAFWFLSWRQLRHPYDVIHFHSIPDFIVFGGLVPKLTGTKLILDIYDLSPEFYLSKFKASEKSWGYKSLRWVEWLSAKFADHVLSANHLWHQKLIARSVPEQKCSPYINYIDTDIFKKRKKTRKDEKFIIIYPGVLNWHQGLDIALRAFRIVKNKVPQAEFHVYGVGPERDALINLSKELGLQDSFFLHEIVPLCEIPQVLANADLGIVAKRADVFGNEAYSTKILEYMSQGLPVVLPRTAIDSYYFDESMARFFEPGNHEDMAVKILQIINDPPLREQLARNALECVEGNSWQKRKADYLALVEGLAEHQPERNRRVAFQG